MKRIIALLFLLVNTLLFYNIREIFIQNDYADMIRVIVVDPDVVHTTAFLVNPVENPMSKETSDSIFELFHKFSRNYDVLIMYEEVNQTWDKFSRYLIASIPIDQRLELITNQSLDFRYQSEKFYTNQHNVENGVNFFLLNERITFTYHPITSLGTLRSGPYTFVARTQHDLDEMISILKEEFGKYVDNVVTMSSTPFDVATEIEAFLTPIILSTMVLIAIVIIIYVHLYSKKIAIQKTMGISLAHIAKELFLPLVLVIISTIIVVNLVLFALFIRAINSRTVPIIFVLLQSGALQVLGVVITLALSCLLLSFIPSYSLLKNSSINRFLMGANYMLKIVVIIAMIPLLYNRIHLLENNFEMLNHTRRIQRQFDVQDYQFIPNQLPGYWSDGHASLMQYFFLELGMGNINPSLIYEYELLYNYHNAYRVLNEAGAIFCLYAPMEGGEPGLLVNSNFLQKYPILDVEGNLVEISQNFDGIVALVPQIYARRSFVQNMLQSGHDVIIVSNGQEVFDFTLSWDFWGITEQPYVITVMGDSHFMLEASPLRNVFFAGDINEALTGTTFHNRVIVSTVGEELDKIFSRNMSELIEHLLILVPSFTLVSVIIIQYSYLFSEVYKKRIYVKMMLGFNRFVIFVQLLFESVLAGLAAMAVVLYLGLDTRLILLVFVLDVLVYFATVMKLKTGNRQHALA